MTTQVIKSNADKPAKASALNVMAARLSVEPSKLLDTLKATVFSKANNEELLALVVVANEFELNPFLKEMYAFPAKGGGIVPIVSVDGWNKLLLRQPDFDGIEFDFVEDEGGKPVTCTATIYVKNRSRPVKITEYFSECVRNTDPWNNMPHRMLRNRTLCQAARVAFGFSAIVSEDEAIDVVATVMPDKPLPVIKSEPGSTRLTEPTTSPITEMGEFLTNNSFTFTVFQKWGMDTGNIPGADSLASLDDVPKDILTRLLKNKTGLIAQLARTKAEMEAA